MGWQLVRREGKLGSGVNFVLVDKADERDRAVYQSAVEALVTPGTWCRIKFWSDPKMVPAALPMTDEQADAEMAEYLVNPYSGHSHFHWSRVFGGPREKTLAQAD